MKKNVLIKTSLFSAILLLNTGCFFGLLGESPKPTKSTTKVMPTSNLSTPNFDNLAPVECTDDINAKSSCHKNLVKPKELKPKLVTPTGGEVYKLKSFRGKKITIIERANGYLFPELKNKIVILEMFGKNCSHCIKEIPVMNKLRRKYRNKLEIVALQVDGKMSKMAANALLRRHHITYPIIDGETATNLQYHVQNTYGWTGVLPFILVIKNGVTEFSYRGQVDYNEINNDISSIIK